LEDPALALVRFALGGRQLNAHALDRVVGQILARHLARAAPKNFGADQLFQQFVLAVGAFGRGRQA
jgi:hypothetical protein